MMMRKSLAFAGIATTAILMMPVAAQIKQPPAPGSLQKPQPAPQIGKPSGPTSVEVKKTPIATPPLKEPGTAIEQPVAGQAPLTSGRVALPAAGTALFRPQLSVTPASLIPAKSTTVAVEISGLGDSAAVHLLNFQTGCGFAANGNGGNLVATDGRNVGFSTDRAARFSIDRASTIIDTPNLNGGDPRKIGHLARNILSFDPVGIPVRNGKAELSLYGRLGVEGTRPYVEFNADQVVAANRDGRFPATGYATFLHNPFRIGPTQTDCHASGVILVKDRAGVWKMLDADGGWVPVDASRAAVRTIAKPFFLRPHRQVTIENTFALKEFFSAAVKPRNGLSVSACEGTSVGPKNYPVGVLNRGGDLAFVVRSGPVGTSCKIETQPAELPEGVQSVSLIFRVDKVGDKCGVPGQGTFQSLYDFALLVHYGFYMAGTSGAYAMMTGEYASSSEFSPLTNDLSNAKQVMPARLIGRDYHSSDPFPTTYLQMSVHGFENPYLFAKGMPGVRLETPVRQPSGHSTDVIEPMVAIIGCSNTLVNDHEVALVLERVIAQVPEGVRFP